jgi:hypothetical protein
MLDTLANVKSRLGITDTAYDTFLTQQIQLISDVIESYCGRRFAKTSYIQTFYSDENSPASKLELYHYPCDLITSIEEDGDVLSSTYYRLHTPSATIKGVGGKTFFHAETTVIEYDAGYDSIPTPILSVLDSLVAERYNKKVAGVDLNFGSDVQRISIPGSIAIDFDYSLSSNERKSAYGSIIGSQANILDDWRSDRVVIGTGKLIYIEDA